MTRARVKVHVISFLIGIVLLAVCIPGAQPALAQTEVSRAVDDFDDVRALALRALQRAQDLKTAHCYGRGFTIGMPAYIGEDVLIEGLWLADYVHAMDGTAMSLLSYGAAAEHPNLEEELELFRAYVGEAARKTIDYYDRVSGALANAIEQVEAAAAKRSPFRFETLPVQRWSDDPWVGAGVGDGFDVGWTWPAIQEEATTLGRHLGQHGYSQERMFELATKSGVSFICPEDRNLFDWIDVEKSDGRYDWARIDRLLALYKKHNMGLWLPLPSYNTSPPLWLRERLKNRAVLTGADGEPLSLKTRGHDKWTGINDIRESNNPINLFDPEVAKLFARYVRQLITHVKGSGVRIVAVQLGDSNPLPFCSGPDAAVRWRAWLKKNNIDPLTRWNMNINIKEAGLPDKLQPAGVSEPGRKQLILDIVRWREDECVEYFRVQVDAIRAAAPDLSICVQSCDSGELNESMNGRPNERLVRDLGLAAYSSSSGSSVWDDLKRSYSPAHWSAGQTYTGAGNALAQYACSSYVHGTFTLFSRPVPLVRGFFMDYSCSYPDVRLQGSGLNGWWRFMERAQGMAPEMVNTKPSPQVAVLWSDTSHRYEAFDTAHIRVAGGYVFGAHNYHKIACVGWGHILNSVDMAHDFITEYQVRQGKLSQYEMLVMPAARALPADIAQHIREYATNGGVVLATSAPALFGDDNQRKGTGQLADVFGADFDRFLSRAAIVKKPMGIPISVQTASSWENKDRRELDGRSDIVHNAYCTFKPQESADVGEWFTSGDPAVIFNSPGKGKTVVIGYPLGQEAFVADAYHLHHGRGSAGGADRSDGNYGSDIALSLLFWVERLLPMIGIERKAAVINEYAPRGPIEWRWTRRESGYRDYGWGRNYAPRSVEIAVRRREGNPNIYLTVFNREGGWGGDDPGVINLEATSKEINVELRFGDVRQIYDVSLGCHVPFIQRRVPTGEAFGAATFSTRIETSSVRMFIISTNDDVIRTYAGNRVHDRTDNVLRKTVSKLAAADPAPQSVIIGRQQILDHLAVQARKGITISAESPLYVPAAKRLAAAIEKAYGKRPRISRLSPRVAMPHDIFIERPNVFLGNHTESHYIAFQKMYWAHYGYAARLPVMTSHTFPGPGRSVVVLMRPYMRRWARGNEETEGKVLAEDPAPPELLIGASDTKGLDRGIEDLLKLIENR